MDLAPIHLSAYKRLWHIQQTVKALQKNDLAQHSVLYISSDAPKPGDENAVSEVKRYIKSIKGFKKVIVIESEQNTNAKHVAYNTIDILNTHKKVIKLEDDVVVNKNFLKYMNEGLDVYEKNDKIFAITAYIPNIQGIFDHEDVFLSRRFNPWGYGLWRRSGLEDVVKSKDAYNDLTSSIVKTLKYWNLSWKHLHGIKRTCTNINERFHGDQLIQYRMFRDSQYCLWPTKSLVKSIGNDEWATGGIKAKRFNTDIDDTRYENWSFDPKILFNPVYDRKLIHFFNKGDNGLLSEYYQRILNLKIILKGMFYEKFFNQ